jgi:hypothetical protein
MTGLPHWYNLKYAELFTPSNLLKFTFPDDNISADSFIKYGSAKTTSLIPADTILVTVQAASANSRCPGRRDGAS